MRYYHSGDPGLPPGDNAKRIPEGLWSTRQKRGSGSPEGKSPAPTVTCLGDTVTVAWSFASSNPSTKWKTTVEQTFADGYSEAFTLAASAGASYFGVDGSADWEDVTKTYIASEITQVEVQECSNDCADFLGDGYNMFVQDVSTGPYPLSASCERRMCVLYGQVPQCPYSFCGGAAYSGNGCQCCLNHDFIDPGYNRDARPPLCND